MKKKILSVTFSSILSLFIAIVLFAGALSAWAYRKVCDPQLLLSVGDNSGYTNELYEEIKYKWENLLAITGVMDPDPIMQVLTQEGVHRTAISFLDDGYTGAATIDTQAIRDELEAEIREYAYSNNIHATPQAELDQNIEELVSACIKEYTNSIKIPLLPRLLGAVSKFASYLEHIPMICGISAAVLLLFIFFLQSKRRNALYYVAISTATNALLILGGLRLAEHYRIIDRLPVEISALRTLVVSYLTALLGELQSYGEVFLLVTVLLLLLYILACVVTAILSRIKKKK